MAPLFGAVLLAAGGSAVGAQNAQIDGSFSNEILPTFGYPEIEVAVTTEGVDAPAELEAGFYHVTLSAPADNVAYLDIVQPPAGLSEEELVEEMLAAGRDDLVQPGWVYVGGSNTPNPGESVSFVVELEPGDYRWGASYYRTEPGAEETMRLAPLTVTAAEGDSVAPPTASVALAMTDDLRYVVEPATVPTGPQVWELTNTGTVQEHHVVMFRLPEGVTAEQIEAEFAGMIGGTPPAGQPLAAQFVWVGYAALQSGGQTTWSEFDLEPGHYAVICFIMDPEMGGRPHLLDGMITTFDVAP